MIHSTTSSDIPKSYRKLDGRELRHRAGLAWARGKRELAEKLEALAVAVGDRMKPGQHRSLNMPRPSSYFKGEHHVVLFAGHRHLGAP